VGVAGGIASGKSSCARRLAGADGVVIDADAIARDVESDPVVVARIEAAMGVPVRATDGSLDRTAVSRAAFADPARLRRLEEIVHPLVTERMKRQLADARATSPPPAIVVLDVPLLFESGLSQWCDRFVFVDADVATRAARARSARGWDPDELSRREALQMPLDEKRRRAHVVIRNAGSPEELARACERAGRDLVASPS